MSNEMYKSIFKIPLEHSRYYWNLEILGLNMDLVQNIRFCLEAIQCYSFCLANLATRPLTLYGTCRLRS